MIRHRLAAGIVALLVVGWLPAPGSAEPAAEAAADPAAAAPAQPVAQPEAQPPETLSVTTHAIDIEGRRLEYRATAGTLALPGRDGGRPEGETREGERGARIFHIAYQALDADPEERPVSFVFNGGPGAASAYLHLGALGPVRAVFNPDGTVPSPPLRMVENAETWLAFTDLVFIDPVGTGYSRGPSPDAGARSDTWGVGQDVSALGEFIRLYLSREGRWLSPKFLIGESYGGIRGARLAEALHQSDRNIALNGLVFVSPAFDYALLDPTPYNLLPWVLNLPSFAATALHYGRSSPAAPAEGRGGEPADPAEVLAEVERFAVEQLLPGLAQGASLDPARQEELFRRHAGYTGLPVEFVQERQGRVGLAAFRRELLRGTGRVVGLYDSTVTAIDPFPGSPTYSGRDPSLEAIGWVLIPVFNAYVRDELDYRTDLPYELLNGAVGGNWDWQSGIDGRQGYVGAGDQLRSVMALNPALRLFIAHGYYDLLTTYFASRYMIDQFALDATIRGNVTLRTYSGGHMIYTHEAARGQLYRDVRAFYREAQTAQRPAPG